MHLAVIEINSECNLKCKHCYGFFENKQIIDLFEFENILLQLKQEGISIVRISGGEPTLMGSKIFEYAKVAKKYFKHVELTTNGVTKLSGLKEEWRLFSNIQVSVDGTEEIHDWVRGKGTYSKSMKFINELKEYKNSVSVMISIGRHNLEHVLELKKILDEIDVKLFAERITSTGRGHDLGKLDYHEVKKIMQLLNDNLVGSSDPLLTMMNPSIKDFLHENCIIGGCSAGISAICIDSSLNVLPCPRLRKTMGNLAEMTLSEIIKTKEFQKLGDRDLLEGKCGKCSDKWICGGCRADSYEEMINYYGEDSGCFYNV